MYSVHSHVDNNIISVFMCVRMYICIFEIHWTKEKKNITPNVGRDHLGAKVGRYVVYSPK